MKRAFYSLSAVSLLVLSATTVSHAQDFLAPIQVKTDAIVSSSTASTSEKKLDGQRGEVSEQFENALASLNNLIARIESRMTKMQASGIDISSSSPLLIVTQADIIISTNNLNDLENLLAEPAATATQETLLANIKTQSDVTKSSIQVTYRSIMNLINELKQELQSSVDTDATTTSNED